MKYMLLINAGELDVSGGAVGCEPEDWMRFDKEINDSGVVVASESLADLVTATRVQVATTVSGPSPTGRSPRPGRCSAGSS